MSIVGKIKEFSGEVAKEMKKVSWPTRDQLRESTMVVVVTTLVFTVFVYGIDWLMSLVLNIIY